MLNKAVVRDGVVIQPDQECDGAGDVDERVQPVDVHHQPWIGHEEFLNRDLPEEVQAFLPFNDFKRMSARNVDCTLNEGDGRECSTELVDLRMSDRRDSVCGAHFLPSK